MSDLSDKELVDLGARGILPGPHETDRDFLHRIKEKGADIPLPAAIEKLFSISPDWVKISHSNKGLLPWQGGFAQMDEESVSIQIRKGKGKIWGIYSRDEIVSHELVHAARMAFEEPIFEEILAYQTSDSKFRRFYGPIFRTSNESLFFLTSLLALGIVNLFYMIPWVMLLWGGTLLSYFLVRLHANQKKFRQAHEKIRKLVGSEKKALSFLLSLTDEEIFSFSRLTHLQMESYVHQQSSLRWRQLRLRFLD
jgi:hypothetical protein